MVQHLINPKRRPGRLEERISGGIAGNSTRDNRIRSEGDQRSVSNAEIGWAPHSQKIGHTPNIQKRMKNQDEIVTKGEYLVFTGKMFTYGYGSWLCLTQLQRSDSTCLIHLGIKHTMGVSKYPMALNPMGKERGQLENSNCPSIIPFRVIYYLWEKKIYQRGELL